MAVYIVFLDGIFCGVAEEEYECWNVASNCINNSLLDDDVDRVSYHKINYERFSYEKEGNCIRDNYDMTYVMDKYEPKWYCGKPNNFYTIKELCKKINAIDLERERAEAKLRAMEL